MDRDEVKAILGIPAEDEQHDARIEALIPLLIDEAQEYCNDDWMVEDEDTGEEELVLPGGVKAWVARACQYHIQSRAGVKSESIGGYSVTLQTPEHILQGLNSYRKVKFI